MQVGGRGHRWAVLSGSVPCEGLACWDTSRSDASA